MNASVRELRASTKSLLSAVGRGDTVIITYRGEPCARLSPLEETRVGKGKSGDDAIFGMWKNNKAVADVEAYVRKVRKGRFA